MRDAHLTHLHRHNAEAAAVERGLLVRHTQRVVAWRLRHEHEILLAYGLALVLVFIGGKMLLIDFVKIPIGYALLVTATLIAGSIFLSLRNSGEAAKGAPPALPPKA